MLVAHPDDAIDRDVYHDCAAAGGTAVTPAGGAEPAGAGPDGTAAGARPDGTAAGERP